MDKDGAEESPRNRALTIRLSLGGPAAFSGSTTTIFTTPLEPGEPPRSPPPRPAAIATLLVLMNSESGQPDGSETEERNRPVRVRMTWYCFLRTHPPGK